MIPKNEGNLPTELYFAMLAKLAETISQTDKFPETYKNAIRSEINTHLSLQLHNYIVSYLNHHYKPYLGSQDAWNELLNTCWCYIFEAFPKYNGKYSLTTFANCYIKAGAKDQIAFWMNKSAYQCSVWIKLRTTMERLKIEQINKENLDQISSESGLSKRQIANSLLTEIASKKNYLLE